jgi:hypothetical protein
MSALARVRNAAWVITALALLQLALANVLAMPVRSAVRAAMGPHAVLDDGHLLAALIELGVRHPAALVTVNAAITSAAVLGAIVAVLTHGALYGALLGRQGATALAGDAVRFALPLLVQGVYNLVLRALAVAIVLVPLAQLDAPMAAQGLALLVLHGLGVALLDLAKADVVAGRVAPFHPRAVVRALRAATRAPLTLLGSLGCTAAQVGLHVGAVIAVIDGFGRGGGLWTARGVAVTVLALGVLRAALAVTARERSPG